MKHDVRFVEDDWESPTLAPGVWLGGLVHGGGVQYTGFQQVGGIDCDRSLELTYGLERLAMYIQGVDSVYDLDFDGRPKDEGGKVYGDVFKQAEWEFSTWNFERAETETLLQHFQDAEAECQRLLDRGTEAAPRRPLPLPAYDQCMKASHLFNSMRGA